MPFDKADGKAVVNVSHANVRRIPRRVKGEVELSKRAVECENLVSRILSLSAADSIDVDYKTPTK
jgi:hypothetical protein